MPTADILTAGKTSIALDLKNAQSLSMFKSLLPQTDVLIDPFRPGILEKLGLDPETVLLKLNPRLIVVRLTGFRKDGKYKDMAGHDINYLAVSGVLSLLGARDTPPLPPGNILADFAGGGLVAFTGVLLALVQRAASGKGQVVDANMVDGVNFLATFPRVLLKTPMWGGERGTNTLDGGAPYYGCYECRDRGRYVSVGALEPKFFAELLRGLGFADKDVVPPGKGWKRDDKRSWDFMRGVFEKRFKEKTRKEWEDVFDGTDACVAPVLTNEEMEESNYDLRPMVGLSRTPGKNTMDSYEATPMKAGEGGEQTLSEWMRWQKGRDYDIDSQGAWILKEKSKL